MGLRLTRRWLRRREVLGRRLGSKGPSLALIASGLAAVGLAASSAGFSTLGAQGHAGESVAGGNASSAAAATLVRLLRSTAGSSNARSAGCAKPSGLTCTRVVVPLDRTGEVPGTVSLNVQVLRTAGHQRGVLFLLAGGPGQAAASAFDLPSYGFLYRVLFPGYTLVVFDSRGTGRSGALRCPSLQTNSEFRQTMISECASALGARREFYSTADNVADIESVRAQLDFAHIGFWGVSYGTKVALAYAEAYPNRVDRLLLDSVVSPQGSDPFEARTLHAIPNKLAGYCAGGACRSATPNFSADTIALANRLAVTPIHGVVRELDGRRKPERIDAETFLDTVVQADLDAGLAATLPAAIHSARAGRPQALLRIVDLSDRFSSQETGQLSNALFAATTCSDGPFPWPSDTPVAKRAPILKAAELQLSTAALGGFGRWAANIGSAKLCSTWPSPASAGPSTAERYPNVPLLALSGQLDMRTPTAAARSVVSRFPRGHLLVVKGAGHSVVTTAPTLCLIEAIHHWLDGEPAATSCGDPQRLAPLGDYPAQIPRRAAAGPGETLTLATKTIQEAEATWFMTALDTPAKHTLIAGLDSGKLDASAAAFTLTNYGIAPGIDLSGRVTATISVDRPPSFTGTLHITGAAAATGTLNVSNSIITSTLHG
jgi:pimeloyl-ACP methyl ester carboxylesterase